MLYRSVLICGKYETQTQQQTYRRTISDVISCWGGGMVGWFDGGMGFINVSML